MNFKIISLLLVTLALSSCQTKQPTPVVDIAPLSAQIDKLSSANADLKIKNGRLTDGNNALAAENARLLSKLRSDVDAGILANNQGRSRLVGFTLDHQSTLLQGIVNDTQTTAWWKQVDDAEKSGNESALMGVIHVLRKDAGDTHDTLGKLYGQVDALTKERDAANEAATAAMAAVSAANDALSSAVEQAVQNENKRVMAEVRASQVEFWNRCGYGLGIAALGLAAGAFFSPMAKKKLAEGSVLSAVLSAASFASARFFASKWFGWAMGIAGAVAGGAYLFHKLKASHAASETAKKAAVYAKFGEFVVPVMDDAYNNASAEDKAILDAKIFDQLSAVEDAQVKALVDEIRASIKLANVDK